MQYKIPVQIENEDVIVAGLSLRQIVIIMVWGGLAYVVFKNTEPRLGATMALVLAVPLAVLGIVIALVKIAEMTFLPVVLNYFRLLLNSKERRWSQGTDSYSEIEIGYIVPATETQSTEANKSYEQAVNDEFMDKIKKL